MKDLIVVTLCFLAVGSMVWIASLEGFQEPTLDTGKWTITDSKSLRFVDQYKAPYTLKLPEDTVICMGPKPVCQTISSWLADQKLADNVKNAVMESMVGR